MLFDSPEFAGFFAIFALLYYLVRGSLRARNVLIVAGSFVVFALQIGNYFRRNRPRCYRPDAIPREVLPKG